MRLESRQAGVPKTLLLVEDDALTALAERRRLEKEGYRVLSVSDGEAAIESACSDGASVDLVLMDVDLGEGMDGTEAARRILAKRDLPLLFLSSHTEKEVVERTEAITNYGYVVKDSSFTVLDASIKMAFKLHEALGRAEQAKCEEEEANEELRTSLESLAEANEKLALSEEKFSKAFHLSPDAVNINRLSDGLYLDINEGFTQITGYAREDVLGRSSLPGDLGIWVREEDRLRLVRGVLETGKVINLEADFRRKDGSVVRGQMSAHRIEINGEACLISITRDIDERMRLEDELNATEQKFRLAFENSPIGISLTDLDGRMRMVNQAFCEMLGLPMEEVSRLDFAGPTHPEDRESALAMSRRLLAGEAPSCRFRKRYVHADGHVIWADLSVALVREADGRPSFFISQILDITEAEEAEKALRRTQSMLRSTMDCQKDIFILSIDRDFNCLYRNRSYHDFKLEQAGVDIQVGDNLLERLVDDPFSRQGIPHYRRALEGEATRIHENHGALDFHADASYTPMYSEEGEIIGASSFSVDITERVRQEAELRETKNRYLDLLNSIGEGFCYVDEREVFRMANPSCGRVFGVPSEELVGRSFFEFLDAEGRAKIEEETKRRTEGLSSEYVAPIIRSDGERRWIRVIASPLGMMPGHYLGASALFRDITEELAANEALTRLVRSKELLMRELQHRTKNSLAIVSSLLSIAMGELSEPRSLEVLENTRSRINSMSAIYERLYRAESVESLDFGTYLEGLARSIFEAFFPDRSRVELVLDLDHAELDTKRAIALGLVVNELFTNAVKYAFPGERRGRITLALEGVLGSLRVLVADDGVGMDPESRGDASSMGMSLIKFLVEKELGASLHLETGQGTSVSIEFPL